VHRPGELATEREHKYMLRIDPACASAVAALGDDPFYRSICAPFVRDDVRRRAVLTQYFAYSIQEGRDFGRCVHLPDHTRGVAVWLLPQPPDVRSRAARNKRAFLETTLDPEGCANYHRIVNFMSAKTASALDPGRGNPERGNPEHGNNDAWYLSIVAVDPASQGQGLGRKLLEPTIAEADRVSATCYLETFSPRNLSFYERLGFVTKARFWEPTTGADYAVMVRYPNSPTKNSAP